MDNIVKYYSVVIPTMWKSTRILEMLPVLENCELIKEIIIIDNDPTQKPNLEKYSKVIYYTQYKNIYVNPAWNVGYKLSNYNLIICNDDIFMSNIHEVLSLISKSDYDIIGLNWETVDNLIISPKEEFTKDGFGCFMYIKNYIMIPNDYKIYRGDYILFEHNKKRGSVSNPKLIGEKSITVKSDRELVKLAKTDLLIYKNNNNL